MTEEIKQRIETIKVGKVPHGYKKTQFGIFPIDWVTDKTLGDMFDFYGGLGISREQLGSKGIAYLHYGDMHKGTFKKVAYEQYNLLPKYNIQLDGNETFLMKDGDVAFLDASEDLEGTSRSVLIDNPDNKFFIAGLHTTLGKPKDDFLDKWYKQYITITDIVKKQFQELAVGFKVYGVNRKEITKIIIPCPSKKDEQNRIAEILSKWDKVIELQEKLIEKLELQKKALMQRLLTPKEGWKKVKIGTLTRELSIRNYQNECINIKSVSNKDGFINQEEQFSKRVASKDISNYKKVSYGNIAYNPSRINVGSIAIYEDKEDGIVSPMYVVFECKKINPHLLLLLLNTDKTQYDIKSYLSGSVRDSLNYSDLEKIEIFIPDERAQSLLFDFFNKKDLLYTKEKEKLKLLKQQQKAMLQLLLTGIVRV